MAGKGGGLLGQSFWAGQLGQDCVDLGGGGRPAPLTTADFCQPLGRNAVVGQFPFPAGIQLLLGLAVLLGLAGGHCRSRAGLDAR